MHFLAVARGLKRLGHDVCILGPQYHTHMRRPEGLRGIFIPVLSRSVLTYLIYQFLAALLLPLIVLTYRTQVILIRGGLGLGFLVQIAARLLGVRVVLEVNGIPWKELAVRGLPKWQARTSRWTMASMCKTAHAVIAVTPMIARELVRVCGIPARRITAIQNGADPAEFSRVNRRSKRAEMGIRPDQFLMGFIGDFSPWHGSLEIIESARELPPEVRRKTTYVLIGTGEGWERAKRVVLKAGLKDIVRLPGWASRQEVTDYLAAFDVGMVINCGWKEAGISGSPLKFWEYLAAGLPVIVSDDEDLSLFVRGEGMGIVVEDTSPRSIAAAIEEMFRRREEFAEIGPRKRELVRRKYSWLEVSRKVARVLAKNGSDKDNLDGLL